MGYVLEFFSCDWEEIRRVLGSGDQRLLATILEDCKKQLLGNDETTDRESPHWASELRALILGARGRELAARGPDEPAGAASEEVSSAMAVAMVAILRAQGTPLGAIRHRSRGGVYFREVFLIEEAAPALRSPVDLRLLLDRPLFGIAHSAFPSWGGLKKAELNRIVAERTEDDLPRLADPTFAGWLFDLWDLLTAAAGSRKDLVTVYF